jgi:NADPH:quinone reductase-like Zn-dependent oxidoreductase
MRAACCDRYGGPEVIELHDVAVPEPGDDELLIRVIAATVNRTDCGIRSATPVLIRAMCGMRRPRRRILGTDFAGVVEAVGPDVRGFETGDRVMGFDDLLMGGHGEYLAIPAKRGVAKIPDGVSFADAAASVEGAHYALNFIDRVGVEEGQRALVYGATGAIGTAAVQLLIARGATVTAIGDTARLELMAGLGADRVIDYTAEDFTTHGLEYNFVLDSVGKTTFRACRGLVADGGWFAGTEFGPRFQNVYLPLLTRFSKKRVAFPLPRDVRSHVELVADLLGEGRFTPVIDRHYDLEEIVDAYRYVEAAQKTGNVVIDVEREA